MDPRSSGWQEVARIGLMSSSMGLLAIFIHTHAIALERSYPVVNGMTLRLGNSVQKVEVRAKSFGPGDCGVKFALRATVVENSSLPR
jgi:hypothetical protein